MENLVRVGCTDHLVGPIANVGTPLPRTDKQSAGPSSTYDPTSVRENPTLTRQQGRPQALIGSYLRSLGVDCTVP